MKEYPHSTVNSILLATHNRKLGHHLPYVFYLRGMN